MNLQIVEEKLFHTHDSKGNFCLVREKQIFYPGINEYKNLSTDILYMEAKK